MNYELAKELKDAGFPNIERVVSKQIEVKMVNLQSVGQLEHEELLGYKMPSLEQLIEVCGDNLTTLMKTNQGWKAGHYVEEQYGDPSYWILEALGPTPLEAVAKLWLALQTNSK